MVACHAFGWCFLFPEYFSKVQSFFYSFFSKIFCQYSLQKIFFELLNILSMAVSLLIRVILLVFRHCITNYYLQQYCLHLKISTQLFLKISFCSAFILHI